MCEPLRELLGFLAPVHGYLGVGKLFPFLCRVKPTA